jgi:hypothetical protein
MIPFIIVIPPEKSAAFFRPEYYNMIPDSSLFFSSPTSFVLKQKK